MTTAAEVITRELALVQSANRSLLKLSKDGSIWLKDHELKSLYRTLSEWEDALIRMHETNSPPTP